MKNQLDALMQQTKDDQADIRKQAAINLGNIAELPDRCKVLASLIELLADEELAVRDAAEEALIKLGGAEAVHALIPYLSGPSTTVLNYAIDILSRIGQAEIDAIRSLLESKDHDIRKFACDILGNLRHAEAVYDLIDLLNDPHVNVAIAAGEALGKIGNPEAVPYLIRALHHPDTWMKCIAAEALGKIGDLRAIEPFIAMSTYEDPIVLYTVIKAMGNLHDERVLPYILTVLQSNPIFAPSAIQAIHTLADGKDPAIYERVRAAGVGEVCIRLLQSENTEVLRSAITLGGQLHLTEAVPQLEQLLKHQDGQIVAEAIHALLRLGDPGVDALHRAALSLHLLLEQTTDAGVQTALRQALSI